MSQLRSYYPQTKSIMMDLVTLNEFRDLCVRDPDHTRCTASLSCLTPLEEELYQLLLNNTLGECLRLEQERIDFNYVCQTILPPVESFSHRGYI